MPSSAQEHKRLSLSSAQQPRKNSLLEKQSTIKSSVLEKLSNFNTQFELAKQAQLNAQERRKERHKESKEQDEEKMSKDRLEKYSKIVQQVYDQEKAKKEVELQVRRHLMTAFARSKQSAGASLNA